MPKEFRRVDTGGLVPNKPVDRGICCVLGSQVNVRSNIPVSVGRAKEAQTQFLFLVEDAIRQLDLAKSVQRYQLAVDEAKVRLNLAMSRRLDDAVADGNQHRKHSRL